MSQRRPYLPAILAAVILVAVRSTSAADLESCRDQFREGQYEQCLGAAQKTLEEGVFATDWRMLEIESLMALGRYPKAVDRVQAAMRDSYTTLPLLYLAHSVYLHNGQRRQAEGMLDRAYRTARYRRVESMSGTDVMALGRCLLRLGAEPRIVLENFYDRALEKDPNCREAYLAAGDLAIAKQDYELAAERYREALKRFGDDPDVHFGLARAFYHNDRGEMIRALDAALHVNPRHVPSLVLRAEHQIDAEDYEGAARFLERALDVNPWYPDAWAYRAVLAHLANDAEAVRRYRDKAFQHWSDNPRVDYLIGRKLSQKYRFEPGAMYQRQALAVDPNYLPAKIQLAQDLLRIGEDQGWELADEVSEEDRYQVEAYNLVNLRDTMSEFETLTEDGIILRMDKLEAAIYGQRALALLKRAKADLCAKYGVEFDRPVAVELFPEQQDFAVRTFGMPGGDGFLGVCFGHVITATSPRLERTSNWEATLWHEFCHAVTLNLTENRMPRWLSEGISVYEELQEDPRWGQRMNPEYRRMILEGEMTPVGELSTAFMSPPSPTHLQFAYYQSAMVVEFLVERYGFDALRAILRNLGEGEQINAALAEHAGPIKGIERDFEAFARKRARNLAPELDWQKPEEEQIAAAEQWVQENTDNYWALTMQGQILMARQQWQEAKGPLEKLMAAYPENVGKDSPYRLLAEVHRNLGEREQEIDMLTQLAARSADATDAYSRLMEVGTEREEWQQVVENGQRYMAVYPMLATVHERIGRATEALGRDEEAVAAYRRLLRLESGDPVDVNYRLARLLQEADPQAARRHLLEALADAPRFRDGHRLLLEIAGEN